MISFTVLFLELFEKKSIFRVLSVVSLLKEKWEKRKNTIRERKSNQTLKVKETSMFVAQFSISKKIYVAVPRGLHKKKVLFVKWKN